MSEQPPTPSGLGVDASGGPVVDPTTNVLNLVDAAIQRQDDLRESEAAHQREMAQLRADYGEKLRNAESARIDAIRKVDVEAVQRAAEVQAAQAQALATQVTVSAETLRTQVLATSEQGNVRLVATLEPIQKAIDDLRRAQYEAQGQKTQIVETQARGGGTALWVGLVVAGTAVIVTLMIGLLGLVLTLYLSGQ
jgi:hypothetical protein